MGISESIKRIKETLEIVAPTDETILIEGETGTGKEVVAHLIHENSSRCDSPFVVVSCASLPADLLESELFGHERGAFTGAYQRKLGRFEIASAGTIFLDEVDDIPIGLQVKLLRVLEEKELQRVGGSERIKVDARVIAATKKNLRVLIAESRFREDLYYRLNVIPVHIPPLRERREDVLPLIDHFLSGARSNSGEVEIDPEALQCLLEYDWPGNVRQLENTLKRVVIMGQGRKIHEDMIPSEIRSGCRTVAAVPWRNGGYAQIMADLECRVLKEAMSRAEGNKSNAAKLLKMKPSTFRDRLAKYELTAD